MVFRESGKAAFREQSDADIAMPRAVHVIRSTRDSFELRVRRTGMVGAHIFLAIWITGVVGFLIYFFHHSDWLFEINGWMADEPVDRNKLIKMGLVASFFVAFLIGCVLALGSLIYSLFAMKRVQGDLYNLNIETSVLGYTWRRVIPRQSIKAFVQVKDGGKGEDSFPSWGLKVLAAEEQTLIYRQPYEVSAWLGRYLARWAGVDYTWGAEAPGK